MAGKPYTESGDKFQIPDMLANHALFIILAISWRYGSLIWIESCGKCLTSNPVLQQLSNKHLMMYIPWLIEFKMEQPDNEPKGNHSNQEIVIM
jgi:hypothetical protein